MIGTNEIIKILKFRKSLKDLAKTGNIFIIRKQNARENGLSVMPLPG